MNQPDDPTPIPVLPYAQGIPVSRPVPSPLANLSFSSLWIGIGGILANFLAMCVLVLCYGISAPPTGAYPRKILPPSNLAPVVPDAASPAGMNSDSRQIVLDVLSHKGLPQSHVAVLSGLLGQVGRRIFPAEGPVTREGIESQIHQAMPHWKDDAGEIQRFVFTTPAGIVDATASRAVFGPLKGRAVWTVGGLFVDEKAQAHWSVVEINRAVNQCALDFGGKLNARQQAALFGALEQTPIDANAIDVLPPPAIQVTSQGIRGKATAEVLIDNSQALWLFPQGQVIAAPTNAASVDPDTAVVAAHAPDTGPWSRASAHRLLYIAIVFMVVYGLLIALSIRARHRDPAARQLFLVHAGLTTILVVFGIIALLDFYQPSQSYSGNGQTHPFIAVFEAVILGTAVIYALHLLQSLNTQAARALHRGLGEGRSFWQHRIWFSREGRMALAQIGVASGVAVVYCGLCIACSQNPWDTDGAAGLAYHLLEALVCLSLLVACVVRYRKPAAALSPPPLKGSLRTIVAAAVILLTAMRLTAAHQTPRVDSQDSSQQLAVATELASKARGTDSAASADAIHDLAALSVEWRNTLIRVEFFKLIGDADHALNVKAALAAHDLWPTPPTTYERYFDEPLRSAGPSARANLVAMLDDTDHRTAAAAGHLLMICSYRDPDASRWRNKYAGTAISRLKGTIPEVTEVFHEGDAQFAASAAARLIAHGGEGLDAVMDGLKDSDPHVRIIALNSLANSAAARSSQARAAMLELMNDPIPQVRSAAETTAGKFRMYDNGTAEATVWSSQLMNPDPQIRVKALAHIRERGLKTPVMRILPALNDPDPQVRSQVDALMSREPDTLVETLRGNGDPAYNILSLASLNPGWGRGLLKRAFPIDSVNAGFSPQYQDEPQSPPAMSPTGWVGHLLLYAAWTSCLLGFLAILFGIARLQKLHALILPGG